MISKFGILLILLIGFQSSSTSKILLKSTNLVPLPSKTVKSKAESFDSLLKQKNEDFEMIDKSFQKIEKIQTKNKNFSLQLNPIVIIFGTAAFFVGIATLIVSLGVPMNLRE